MNDYYFLNTSGFGGGFEGIHLGFADLAVAYLRGSDQDYRPGIFRSAGAAGVCHLRDVGG